MRLYEEYSRRHDLKDVMLAHHCSNATVLLGVDSLSSWQSLLKQTVLGKMPKYAFFQIRWDHSDHHPGHYQVSLAYPVHDGYLNDAIFSIHSITQLKWHEYESFIFNYALEYLKDTRTFGDFQEMSMIGWEMFVLGYDTWFNRQNGEIKYLLFESLDKDNDLEKRWGYCQELLRKLQVASPAVARCWKHEVFSRINSHAGWLANLLERKCKKPILQLE